MPYIVVKSNAQETDCRELTGPMVLGRSPECDLTIRDIALSRRHCRIELTEQGWAIIDLASKNGTNVNGEALNGSPRLMMEGDTIRLGRSRIVFHAGILEEGTYDRTPATIRPLDPHEALAGTVAGFTFLEAGETEKHENMPCPKPQPKGPASLQGEELQELLTAIASSSWDSIYAEARQPAVMRPMPSEDRPRRRVARPRSPIDLSLQVCSTIVEDEPEAVVEEQAMAATEVPIAVPVEIPIPAPQQERSKKTGRAWRVSMQRNRGFAVVGLCLAAGLLWGNIFWPQSARNPMSPKAAVAVGPQAMPLQLMDSKPARNDPTARQASAITSVLHHVPFGAMKLPEWFSASTQWKLDLGSPDVEPYLTAGQEIIISGPLGAW